jgi:hypothetical protein
MFNPDLSKCIPPEGGSCPNGFGVNEDGQCFPDTECPSGHARMDDDESGACIPFNTIDYGDGCPPESANPDDGCTLEGYHCTNDGCGYYSHGVCEQCYPRTGTESVPLPIDPTIATTSESEIGAFGDPQGGVGCLNAGQTEGEDECILDTPENRAELATEEPTQLLTEDPTTVPQFGMEEDLDPDHQLGLQQQGDGDIVEEDQIAEDLNDIDSTDTGSSEEDTDTDISDGDDVENSVSSDVDDNGEDDGGSS